VPSFQAAKVKHKFIGGLTRLPIATILVADDSGSLVPMRFSVQERLSGEEWFTRREKLSEQDIQEALASLGDVVGRLHRPVLGAFGSLLEPGEASCIDALRDHAMSIVRHKRLRDDFIQLLEDNAELWDDVRPGITHEDLHGFNILFDPLRRTEVSGLLDFDKAWSGPAESDLARMELWRGMTSLSFLERYREHIPELHGYRERRPFYQLLWCLEYAQDSADHLATTNALAAKVGMPQVPSFNFEQ
jgi:Ser/Thr protein kinase RdoA (MazF antagonist)